MKHLPRQIPVICVATDVTPAPDWRGYDVAVYSKVATNAKTGVLHNEQFL